MLWPFSEGEQVVEYVLKRIEDDETADNIIVSINTEQSVQCFHNSVVWVSNSLC